MTRKIIALATAASISLAAAAPAFSQAMDMGFNMLTGAVFNELQSRGLPTDNVSNLTLNQIGQIRAVLNDDSLSESNQNQRIEAIIRNQ